MVTDSDPSAVLDIRVLAMSPAPSRSGILITADRPITRGRSAGVAVLETCRLGMHELGLGRGGVPDPADLAIVMRARRPRGVHELSTITGHGTEWLDAHDRESRMFPDWDGLPKTRWTGHLSLVIMWSRVRLSHPAPR